MVIWKWSNIIYKTGVRPGGRNIFVKLQHVMDIWKCLNLQDPKNAHGTTRVGMQHWEDIWKYLNGQERTDVRGMKILVVMQQMVDT